MRVSGITLPDTKRLEVALTALYGIGISKAARILSEVDIDGSKRPHDLSSEEEGRLRKRVEAERIEGELRREVSAHIKRLRDIQCYRGTRLSKRLPARGQRTRTNARTLKGVRKTMGSGKRKLEKK